MNALECVMRDRSELKQRNAELVKIIKEMRNWMELADDELRPLEDHIKGLHGDELTLLRAQAQDILKRTEDF